MIPTQETRHVETARELLIGQFKNRDVIQGFLDVLSRRCQELEDVFWDIIEKRRLAIAVGAQLDTLGLLVGEKRLGRDDDLYRAAIRLRIRVNRSKGRITDVIDVTMMATPEGETARVTEYSFLGFEVEIYDLDGERYIAQLLDKTRAATSYGLLVTSDLDKSDLLVWDDAVDPDPALETFSDSISGGKVCASGYGLPTDFSGIVLSSSAAPVVTSVNKTYTRSQGGILLTITGTGFTGATGATIGGTAATSVTVLNDTTITCITPTKAAGAHDVAVTGPGGTGTLAAGIEYVDPTSIFAASLMRWYSAAYAGGVWTDASGGANTSQATAGKRPTATTLAATADRPGTHAALLFDGADDALNSGSDEELFTTEGVVAAIIKSASIGQDALIVAKLYGGEPWQLGSDRTAATGKVAFGVNGSTSGALAISDAALDDDAVHRLIGTFKGHATDPTTKLYVDGALQADLGTGGTAVTDTGDFVAIGCAMNTEATTDYHWNGVVAEVVIADVEPTATQRAKLDAYLRDCAGQAT